jgi:hypothetical protein
MRWLHSSFETPRKSAAPQDEGPYFTALRKISFILFVNAMFTTFMCAGFTNVFDGTARNPASPCVWRACIAD